MFVKSFIQNSIHYLRHSLQPTLFPATCLLCGSTIHHSATANICRDCQANLPILPHHCKQCAQILPEFSRRVTICQKCIKIPPPFTRTFALFPYQFPLPTLIGELKFKQKLTHAKLFGDFICKAFPTWYGLDSKPDYIIPIPLHESRIKTRGFNQVREILRGVDRRLGIPIDASSASRRRYTKAQSGLSASQRRANLNNAFNINRHYQGKHIAVVDDVVTTGQTITTFCTLLKEHDAGQIDVWCCARA